MPELFGDVPEIECLIRREYLFDMQEGQGEYERALIFAVTSLPSHALMFTVLTEQGIMRDRLPLAAFCAFEKKHEPHIPNHYLQLWDCFSPHFAVCKHSYITGLRVRTILRDRSMHWGEYLFTIDWYGNEISEMPGDGGHKTAHIIQLDCGCFAAQPNHRVLVSEPSWCIKPILKIPEDLPKHRVNTQVYRCEQHGKWITGDTDHQFWGLTDD